MTGKVYLGIDVSKATLNFAAETGGEGTITNVPSAIRQKLQKLRGQHPGLHVCLESTGVYGRALLDVCHEQGVTVSLLNARAVHHWAIACGTLAKTDRLDARMLCRYGRAQAPRPTPPTAPWKRKLQGLRDMREILLKAKIRFHGHLEQAHSKPLAAMLRKEIARLDKKIGALDARMEAHFKASDPALLKRLTSVKGVASLTACQLIAALPELGTLGKQTVSALAGLAPLTRESGKLKGAGHTGGGRPRLRALLKMPASSAIQHNPVIKTFYERKRAEGKRGDVALTAVMRKLLVLLERIAGDPGFVPSDGEELNIKTK